MKSLSKRLPSLIAALTLCLVSATGSAKCVGTFPNIVTDVCWSCMYPIKLIGATLIGAGDAEDNNSSPAQLACGCGNIATIGLPISFWEPTRLIEVTRTPYCYMSLGGVELTGPVDAPDGTVEIDKDEQHSSFYQVHVFYDTIMSWANIVTDSHCLEQQPWDMAYSTEFDPSWHDDEMTMLLNPEVALFSNPVAVAACTLDCLASNFHGGFGIAAMHWCAGCNGTIYPLNGIVRDHVGAVQASALLVSRIATKLHREGILWAGAGSQGLCGYYTQPIMDKTNYKFSMLYPNAQTGGCAKNAAAGSGSGSTSSSGGTAGGSAGSSGGTGNTQPGLAGAVCNGGDPCCQPLGRTPLVWGASRSYPVEGEDFSYLLFRKRDCCQGRY